jgi:hypothetical protein
VDAAVAAPAQEPSWDEGALARAFEAARDAVQAEADRRGVPVDDLSTTLQVAVVDGGRVLAGMVGDGAIVADVAGSGGARVVLEPADSAFANEVVPVTATDWQDALRVADAEGVAAALLFTDGLTRLLLSRSRSGWTPFAPFFEHFLPRLAAEEPQALVASLVGSAEVDKAWDDDKCLVVMARA